MKYKGEKPPSPPPPVPLMEDEEVPNSTTRFYSAKFGRLTNRATSPNQNSRPKPHEGILRRGDQLRDWQHKSTNNKTVTISPLIELVGGRSDDPLDHSEAMTWAPLNTRQRTGAGSQPPCAIMNPPDNTYDTIRAETLASWLNVQKSNAHDDSYNFNPNRVSHPATGLRYEKATYDEMIPAVEATAVAFLNLNYKVRSNDDTDNSDGALRTPADGSQPCDYPLAQEIFEAGETTRDLRDHLNHAVLNSIAHVSKNGHKYSKFTEHPGNKTEASDIQTCERPFLGPKHNSFKVSDDREVCTLITKGAITPTSLSKQEQKSKVIIRVLMIRTFKLDDNGAFRAKSRLCPNGKTIKYSDGTLSTKGLPKKPLTYCPTIPDLALKVFFNVASSGGHEIRRMDFEQAFAQTKCEMEYYLKLPPRQRSPEIQEALSNAQPCSDLSPQAPSGNSEDVFLRINSYLYGLPESGRKWWLKLRTVLISEGLKEHPSWECFFVRNEQDGSKSFFALHVDDILGFNTRSKSVIEELFLKITDAANGGLRASPPDDLHGKFFLGVRYTQYNNGCWRADQRHYIADLQLKFPPRKKHSSLIAKTQLPEIDLGPSQRSLSEADVESLSERYGNNFPSAVGCLIYLFFRNKFRDFFKTRPDLKPATVFLAAHTKLPGERHFKALQQFLHYIYCTADVHFNFAGRGRIGPDPITGLDDSAVGYATGLPKTPPSHIDFIFEPPSPVPQNPPEGGYLDKDGNLQIRSEADAEHKRSTSGKYVTCHVLYYGGSAVLLNVVIPKLTSQNTTCTEAQGNAAGGESLSILIENLAAPDFDLYKHNPEAPPIQHCDNDALVKVFNNKKKPPVPKCKDHIKMAILKLYDMILNNRIRVHHIRSRHNSSDLGTKQLGALANAIHTCTIQNISQYSNSFLASIIKEKSKALRKTPHELAEANSTTADYPSKPTRFNGKPDPDVPL